ncbi:MAG TPA: CoB--CoM heterodisulfide reductase iron-sulfur subunit B family protein [Methanothrix sp.]|nr:CoB--CoM heterodisulfide reductase iron-sulfur subunit B family protein [Methanothrix sp.]HOK58985.1 CoB--CoM heterodisulfide reductase iron-sulfur subunit B family protein [Methanothrix sp.]HOL44268.1 CoB--CoM heterodisulfide reductase iron-sulfur subunit B family protein [Methanothrix sp.]HPO89246.1 CoB--CoM heterodisulfide reductase iron-sulfur subunit B family protein [Methanothrix sp.]
MSEIAYYPGCVSKATGREYDISTRSVARALGIELIELEDWSCCGATHVPNEMLSVGLAARNLTQSSLPIMTTCSICYSNLRSAIRRLEDNGLRARLNSVLERKYKGARVMHVVEMLSESLKNRELPIKLSGLRVSPYYGCLLTRPGNGIDSPEHPKVLEDLVRTLGAEPVESPLKMLCCGGPVFMSREDAALESAYHILMSAKRAGADMIMAVCPLCHLMLDAKQGTIERRYGVDLRIPVLYITQLAGIALGLGPDDLALGMNSISPLPLVERVYQSMTAD